MYGYSFSLSRQSGGTTQIHDITTEVQQQVRESGVKNGFVLLFVPGSTAALTTIEYEAGVVEDLKDAIERLAPRSIQYRHDAAWGDGNGFAHVRAALLGPSLVIPIESARLALGTWQQIVLIDFDNKPRTRRVTGLVVKCEPKD